MTEALEFFKAIEGKSADQLKEDAKVQRYKERWRNTTFGKKKLQLNQLQDLFGFACEHGGKEDVEEFQKLAQDMVRDCDPGQTVTQERMQPLREAIVERMASAHVNPPARILEDEDLVKAEKPPAQWSEGLQVVPQEYIAKMVGRRTNAVDADGESLAEALEEEEEEELSTEQKDKNKAKLVGRGKKRSAIMLNETMS